MTGFSIFVPCGSDENGKPLGPAPKGSFTSLRSKTTGKQVFENANDKTKPWQERVHYAVKELWPGGPTRNAYRISMVFIFPWLKKHYRTGEFKHLLRDDAPWWHTQIPNADKLIRTIFDALTGVVYNDDKQVASMGQVDKRYSDKPGVHLTVEEISTGKDER